MSDYSAFFLNSKSSIVQLETLTISHSAFTQTYYLVRNAVEGITATLEDSTSHFFQYSPLSITPIGASDDLDQSLKIAFGDLGEILPMELDSVASHDGFGEKPVIKYRVYRSDDLEHILCGPIILEAKSFSFNREGSTFEARAPSLNINQTGELYTFDRFPMLKGFL
jgi:hypothetical protein